MTDEEVRVCVLDVLVEMEMLKNRVVVSRCVPVKLQLCDSPRGVVHVFGEVEVATVHSVSRRREGLQSMKKMGKLLILFIDALVLVSASLTDVEAEVDEQGDLVGDFVGEGENLDVTLQRVMGRDGEGGVCLEEKIRKNDGRARGQMSQIVGGRRGRRRVAIKVRFRGCGGRWGRIGRIVIERGEMRKIKAVCIVGQEFGFLEKSCVVGTR